jgi:hypothetical protein
LGSWPEASSPVVSAASGDLLAHQTSQRAPKTGIFSTTSKKKTGSNPSTSPVYPRRLTADGPKSPHIGGF